MIFTVTDNETGLPISKALIFMDKIQKKTDKSGRAIFTEVKPGEHQYIVYKKDHFPVADIINVAGETEVKIKLNTIEEKGTEEEHEDEEKEERGIRGSIKKDICVLMDGAGTSWT